MKRVLLIESGQFIGGVIRSLFSNNEQLNIIEAAPANYRELIDAVQTHRPEIVVMDDTLQLEYLSQLLRYMQASEDMRVVIVNTNQNKVDVYQKQHINVRQTADFLAVL